jgi:hypothetical protein
MRRRCLISALFALHAASASAQEALREYLAGESAAAARKQSIENQPANVRLGSASLLLGANLELELNDNINLTDAARQQDLILRPTLNLTASAPISELNAFYTSLDIGYAKYINYGQYDRVLIAPGSALGFDFYAGDFHFNLHDQLSYTENPIAQPALSGVADFGQFSNTSGLGVDWELNDLTLSLGYDFSRVISATSQFAYLNRNSDSVVGRATFRSELPVKWGVETSAGFTYYDQTFLNNNLSLSLGAFADWQPTPYLHVKPRAGYVLYTFGSTGSNPQSPDENAYYAGLEVEHQLNEMISYTVEAGREIQLGVYSELLDLWYVRPHADLKIFRDVGTSARVFYEHGNETGKTVLNLNEKFSRIGAGISASYQLTPKLVLRAAYDYTIKNSNISVRTYHQNRITIDFSCQF